MRSLMRAARLLILAAAVVLLLLPGAFSASAENDPLYIRITVANKTYDGTAVQPTIEYFSDAGYTTPVAVDSENVTVEYYSQDDLVAPLGEAPSDAGNYRVIVTYDEGIATPEYADQIEQKDFIIVPKSISVTMRSMNKTYGTDPVWLSNIFPGLATGDLPADLNVDYSWYESEGNVNAGTHTYTSYDYDNSNYDIIAIQWTYSFIAKSIDIIINNKSTDYGDSFSLEAVLDEDSELEYEDDLETLGLKYFIDSVAFEGLDFSIYDAGTYTISAVSDNDNYDITFTNGTLTVSPFEVDITVSGTAVYGTPVNRTRSVPPDEDVFDFEVNNEGEIPEWDTYDDVQALFYVDVAKPTVDSNYRIRCDALNGNYSIKLNEAYLIVTPKEFRAEINDLSVTYGASPSFTLTVDPEFGYATGDNVGSLGIIYSGAGSNVSETPYTITAEISSSDYNAIIEDGELTVNPKAVIVNVPAVSVVYGNSATLSFYLSDVTPMVFPDTLATLGITYSAPETLVGNYNATLDWNNLNYAVTFSGGSYSITKANVSIKIYDVNIVYGNAPTYSCALTGGTTLVYDDTLDDLNISYVPNSVQYGKHSISGSYSNPNYNVTIFNGELNVAKRSITVVIDDVTVVYGETPEYDYDLKAGSSLAEWDTKEALEITCSSTGVNFKDAPFIIYKSYNNNNYNITFEDGYHYILKRPITIRVGNVEREFGEALEFDGDDIEIIEGTMARSETLDTLNLTFETTGSVVNEYPLNVTADNTNYEVTIINGTLTIKKRVVHIEVENIIKQFGDKDPQITFTSDVDGVPFSGSLSREKGESEGRYQIEIGTLSAGENYELRLSDSYLIIENAMPPLAYAGIGVLGVSLLGAVFLVIRKIMGAQIV
jgi:hypothetical protein